MYGQDPVSFKVHYVVFHTPPFAYSPYENIFEFFVDLDCYNMKTVWEAVELKVAPQTIRYCHTRSRIYSCANSSQRQIVRTSLWNIIESIVTHEMTGKSADSSYAMERWFPETRSSG